MSSTRIIAVDPGGTTGIATTVFDGDGGWSGFSSREEIHLSGALNWVDLLLTHKVANHELVVERFTITPATARMSAQYDALYIIGALMYLAHETQVKMTLQPPAGAKRVATNARLEQLGWRNPTKGGHADDAARHLLVRALKLNLIDLKEFS
jgi:hypothetical protein